jgi:hypothetical protein
MSSRRYSRTCAALVVSVGIAILGLSERPVAASARAAVGSGQLGHLFGISADSATDAWAVGDYFNQGTQADETQAVHWNGTNWSRVVSPNPGGAGVGGYSFLGGVSTDSATDAWAVGNYTNPTTQATETLVLHWNGTQWTKVASPSPGGLANGNSSILNSVSAYSATDVWAAGYFYNPAKGATQPLILHWNGTRWSKVASPSPGGTANGDSSELFGISADSATDAWSVGEYGVPTTGATDTLILHWNGIHWSKVASPDPGGAGAGAYSVLSGVSGTSATNLWAVGTYKDPATQAWNDTLVLHWDGTHWITVSSPNPGGAVNGSFSKLSGVGADSPTDAWAVGSYSNTTTGAIETLVLRWNGTVWSVVGSPNPGDAGGTGDSEVYGVSAHSASDAWAVGYYSDPATGSFVTLVLHWNGSNWSSG